MNSTLAQGAATFQSLDGNEVAAKGPHEKAARYRASSDWKVAVPCASVHQGILSVLLFLFFLFALHLSLFGAPAPLIRATLNTSGTVFIGQKNTLVVELLAPGYFDSAASFDLTDPHGLLLMPPVGSPSVSSETIAGTAYTVQRHELALFSPRAGSQTLPPITIRFAYKLVPLDKDIQRAELKTPALTFTVTAPPGSENLGQVISARNLTATETWNPVTTGAASFKTGDALTHTISYTAPDIPGMIFPPFPHAPIAGLAIYPKPPEVLDTTNRGTLTGSRRDTITYICEKPGTYTIPGARLTWFDLDANQLRTIDFPARTFTVVANSTVSPQTVDHASAHTVNMQWLPVLIGFCTFVVLTFVFRHQLAACLALFRPVYLSPLNPTKQK